MTLKAVRNQMMSQDRRVRADALKAMLGAHREGRVSCRPTQHLVNMHCHTIFSYNGYGHTPTSLAWLAKENGWYAAATVEFDVLDGVSESLEAFDATEVRGAAGIETRAFLPEFANRDMNSPGEQGVLYLVGIGFVSSNAPTQAAHVLNSMRSRAEQRNRDMVLRLNAHLDPVALDYDLEVLTRTPEGNATERHLLIAYDAAARERFPNRRDLLAFWADKLGKSPADVAAFLTDEPFPHDAIRAGLMKRGGVAYVRPGTDTFPDADVVIKAFIACGALPLYAFLDGSTDGEQDIEELLGMLVQKGIVGINIIPDRNWNWSDAKVSAAKVADLYRLVDLARRLDLPMIVGTEMNKYGQRLVDDLEVDALRPLRDDFISGAMFAYGHTVMARALGLGYQSEWARDRFPERGARNAFYVVVGRTVAPGKVGIASLSALGPDRQPAEYVSLLGG